MARPLKHTQEQTDMMVRLRNEGLKHREIADTMGISQTSVTRHLRASGMKPIRERHPYRYQVVKMIHDGKTHQAIIDATGCDIEYIIEVTKRVEHNTELLMSFKQIGKELGVGARTARNIYIEAMDKLKTYCETNDVDIPSYIAFMDECDEIFNEPYIDLGYTAD